MENLNLLLATIANYVVKTNVGDLLIDYPVIESELNKGNSVVIWARASGSALMQRFNACFDYDASYKECLAKCQRSLGVDVEIIIDPDRHVHIKNFKCDKWTIKNMAIALKERYFYVEVVE